MSTAQDLGWGDEPAARLSRLAHTARVALQCDGLLVTHRDNQGHVQIAAVEGLENFGRRKLARAVAGIDGWATSPGAVPLPDVLAHRNAWAADLIRYGFGHALFVPITRERVTIGVLTALRSTDHFSESELSNAQAFAQHFDVALAPRARALPDSLFGLLRGLETVNQRAETVSTSDLCAMLDAALAPVLGPVHTGLAVWDEDQRCLRLVSSTLPAETWKASVTDLESSTVRVFISGSPYVTDHASTDPGVVTHQARRFGSEQMIQIQLNVAGKPIGVVTIALADRPPFENLEAVERLAPHLATVVDYARTTIRLRRDVELTSAVSELAMTIASSDPGSSELRFDDSLAKLRSALAADTVVLVQHDGTSVADTAPNAIDVGRDALRLAETHPDGIQQLRLSTTNGDEGCWLYTMPVALNGERIATVAALRQGDEKFGRNECLALQQVANLIALAWSKNRHWQQKFRLAKMEERERLANDLHDDVAQLLFAAQVSLDLAMDGNEEPGSTVTRARELTASADAVIRKLIHERADPAVPEFKPGLSEVVSQVERDYGIAVDLKITADDLLPGVPPAATSALIRVAREALVNVAKHAGHCRAQVRVEAGDDGQLIMMISDNGTGLAGDNAHRGYGLTSMRRSLARHGGTFHVSFTPSGTTVTATVRLS